MTPANTVVHVFGRMERGGAEMRTIDILRHVNRENFRLHFCVLSGLAGELDDTIRSLGGEIDYCKLDWRFPWRFPRLLRQLQTTVVHSHVQYFSGYVLRLAKQAGIPLRIAHFRNTPPPEIGLRHRLQYALMRRWLAAHATHLLGNGEGSLAESWSPDWLGDPRCAVIHNGLDVGGFPTAADRDGVRTEFGWDKRTRLVVHVGRMDPQKNHIRLLEVAAHLLRKDATCRLLLVGRPDAALQARLGERARELGVRQAIVFAGTRSDVPRLLAAADLMLFPSLYEGLPGVVLEACAVGTPVVTTNLPGTLEIAARFPSVRCLPLSASDDAWAEVCWQLLLDPGLPSLRDGARERFEASAYSIATCVHAHELVWSGAAAKGIRRLYGPAEPQVGTLPAADWAAGAARDTSGRPSSRGKSVPSSR
jgi:glycosyltransferase involved in cell wall biosynthesis